MFTLVKFSNPTTAKIVNTGNNRYLTSKLDEKRNLEVQVKNKNKQVDELQIFETNHRKLYYTNESFRIKERNFSLTDVYETDFRDTKLHQLFVWYFRGMLANLKEIEQLNCHIREQ